MDVDAQTVETFIGWVVCRKSTADRQRKCFRYLSVTYRLLSIPKSLRPTQPHMLPQVPPPNPILIIELVTLNLRSH